MMRFLFFLCFFCSLAGGPASGTGVTVLSNANIYTLDDGQSRARALAWSAEGKILASGDQQSVMAAYPDARIIDLGGKTVVPGLVDAHAHLMSLGLKLMRADLVDTGSKAEVVARLQEFAADLPPDAWLLGRGWDQNDWPEKDFPDRNDLDQAFPTRPVWLRRIDGHAGWANSAALAVTDRRFDGQWQPEGGRIVRDEQGRASGVLVDRAMDLVEAGVPKTTAAERTEALSRALAHAASLGLTGVHEAGTSLQDLHLYQAFIERGAFSLRLYAMADGEGEALDLLCQKGHINEPRGLLTVRAVKFYADGALGSRGAALLAPYADEPENSGLLLQSPERLNAMVERAMGCGLQVAVHAIGDRGNQVVLDALEAGARLHPDNPGRHRIEHAQVIAAQDFKRFRQQSLIASVQPTHATSDMYWAEARIGAQRIKGAYAWRRLKDLAVPLALGSDFPVERVNPLLGFHAAVTRQDNKAWPAGGWYPDQRMTRDEALHGFTLGAAFAAFAEQRLGSLAPGKQADLVVLSEDIMVIDASRILDTQVLMTIVGGRTVYTRNKD